MRVDSVPAAAALVLVLVGLVACAGPSDDGASGAAATRPAATADDAASITVYSGRSESLIGPLLERFESEHGVTVEVRYGETAELAATLMEEAAHTPADLFVSQDAAALGALADRGLLRPLPDDVVAAVPPTFRSRDRHWVGISGRARSVVYDAERLGPEELPQSLVEVADPRYRGRFGVAPANGSFQAHMAVYGVVNGESALAELLAGIAANEPHSYPKNSAIVEAVGRGEVDWGLINHYYLWRALDEDPGHPGANFFMPGEDGSGFVNLAGAGLLSEAPEAVELVRFLLSAEAQTYFAEQTFEYPLAVGTGVEPAPGLPPLAELATPEVSFGDVAEALPATLEAIRESGLLP